MMWKHGEKELWKFLDAFAFNSNHPTITDAAGYWDEVGNQLVTDSYIIVNDIFMPGYVTSFTVKNC